MNYQTNTYHRNHRTIAKPTEKVIAFIDAEVVKNPNYAANLNPETELILIDSTRDGIKQITEVLAERHNIKSLQIITAANDNEGSLTLGLSQLNIHTLETYLGDLYQWRNALSSQPEILIYGCLVAVESIFHNFIHQLARITGADIGAFVIFCDSVTINNTVNNTTNSTTNNKGSDRYSLMVAWRS